MKADTHKAQTLWRNLAQLYARHLVSALHAYNTNIDAHRLSRICTVPVLRYAGKQ